MQAHEETYPYMDRQTQLLILFSGVLGLTLAILTATPKKAVDAVVAMLAGLFGALIIAPAIAETMTNVSRSFAWFTWMDASPGTAFFSAIIGLGGMLGFQIVAALQQDFVSLIRKYARKRLKLNDDTSESDS